MMMSAISHATIATSTGSVEELVPSDSNERRISAETEKERKRKIRAGIMISTCWFSHDSLHAFFF